MMPLEFKASVEPPELQVTEAWWFIYSNYRLLVKVSDNSAEIPFIKDPEELGITLERRLYLGTLKGSPCYAAQIEEKSNVPAGLVLEELRSIFDRMDGSFFAAAFTGVHLIEWDKNNRFCARCKGELHARKDVRAKECRDCGRLEFPRLSPAIIVLIEKEDMLLLARSARFPGAFFSVLAGFVEPGESLEEAVCREVLEETGIHVKDVRYFGSQPWPFPDSLMIGFTAQYESGEIKVDGEEIVEAGWYRADNLPKIPGRVSISRQLIDSFLMKRGNPIVPD